MKIIDSQSPVLSAEKVKKIYNSGGHELTVLHEASFEIGKGSTAAILGPSGSGKTTLLGLCAGLDAPSSGRVTLCGHALSEMNEEERSAVRNKHVGFVFQSFHLLPTLTALENVMVPMELRGNGRSAAKRAMELLAEVGLAERATHYPVQLSGGEQQRVALARAFINEPDVLFADEPTGNLDGDNRHHVADLLFQLNEQKGTTLILVTHDLELAARTQRVLRIKDGAVSEEGAR